MSWARVQQRIKPSSYHPPTLPHGKFPGRWLAGGAGPRGSQPLDQRPIGSAVASKRRAAVGRQGQGSRPTRASHVSAISSFQKSEHLASTPHPRPAHPQHVCRRRRRRALNPAPTPRQQQRPYPSSPLPDAAFPRFLPTSRAPAMTILLDRNPNLDPSQQP